MKKTITLFTLVLITDWCFGQICFPVTSLGGESIYNRKVFSFNNMSYPIGYPFTLTSTTKPVIKTNGDGSFTQNKFTNLIVFPKVYSFNRFSFRNKELLFQPNGNDLTIELDNDANNIYRYSRLSTQSSGITLVLINGIQKQYSSDGSRGGSAITASTIKRPFGVTASVDYLWGANHLSKFSTNGNDYEKQKNTLSSYLNRWQYSVSIDTAISYVWIRAGYSNSLFKDELNAHIFLSKARLSVGVNLLNFL